MTAIITKKFRFEASHQLTKLDKSHKCTKLHGHSFVVEISIKGIFKNEYAWVLDHAEISKIVNPLIKRLDHCHLNDIKGLENPTIENLCLWFWKKIASDCPLLYKIVIHETANASCTFYGLDYK